MVGRILTHPGVETSQGQAAAAFLGQASYNMDAAMVTEISDFKARCDPTI